MKRLAVVLAAIVALGWTAGSAWAQEEQPETPKPKKERREKKERKERPKPKQPLLRGEYGIMVSVCKLDEEGQKKIAEILTQRDAATKEFNPKRKAAREKLAEARKSGDKDAVKTAQAEAHQLEAEYQKAWKKWQADILGVLTPEQNAKWQEFTFLRDIKGRLPGVKLTDDQLDKVKAAYVEHTTGVDLTDAKARHLASPYDQ